MENIKNTLKTFVENEEIEELIDYLYGLKKEERSSLTGSLDEILEDIDQEGARKLIWFVLKNELSSNSQLSFTNIVFPSTNRKEQIKFLTEIHDYADNINLRSNEAIFHAQIAYIISYLNILEKEYDTSIGFLREGIYSLTPFVHKNLDPFIWEAYKTLIYHYKTILHLSNDELDINGFIINELKKLVKYDKYRLSEDNSIKNKLQLAYDYFLLSDYYTLIPDKKRALIYLIKAYNIFKKDLFDKEIVQSGLYFHYLLKRYLFTPFGIDWEDKITKLVEDYIKKVLEDYKDDEDIVLNVLTSLFDFYYSLDEFDKQLKILDYLDTIEVTNIEDINLKKLSILIANYRQLSEEPYGFKDIQTQLNFNLRLKELLEAKLKIKFDFDTFKLLYDLYERSISLFLHSNEIDKAKSWLEELSQYCQKVLGIDEDNYKEFYGLFINSKILFLRLLLQNKEDDLLEKLSNDLNKELNENTGANEFLIHKATLQQLFAVTAKTEQERLNHFEKAIDFYEMSEENLEDYFDDLEVAYINLGNLLLSQNKVEQATEYLNKFLKLLDNGNINLLLRKKSNIFKLTLLLNRVIEFFENKNNLEQVKKYKKYLNDLTETVKISKILFNNLNFSSSDIDNLEKLMKSLNEASIDNLTNEKLDEILELEQELSNDLKDNNSRIIRDTLFLSDFRLGILFFDQKDFKRASIYFKKGLDILFKYRLALDPDQLETFLDTFVYYIESEIQIENYNVAFKYTKQLIGILKELEKKVNFDFLYLNYGQAYNNQIALADVLENEEAKESTFREFYGLLKKAYENDIDPELLDLLYFKFQDSLDYLGDEESLISDTFANEAAELRISLEEQYEAQILGEFGKRVLILLLLTEVVKNNSLNITVPKMIKARQIFNSLNKDKILYDEFSREVEPTIQYLEDYYSDFIIKPKATRKKRGPSKKTQKKRRKQNRARKKKKK